MIILYDLTRIYLRRKAHAATGIDRVDINYCMQIIQLGLPVCFLVGKGSKFLVISKKKAVKTISSVAQRWGGLSIKHDNNIINDSHSTINDLISKDNAYIYINISHNYLRGHSDLIKLALSNKVKIIYYCHDLIPIDYPEYVNFNGLRKHKLFIKFILETSNVIIVNSQYTLDRLKKFAIENQYRIPDIKVIEIGVESNLIDVHWQKTDRHEHFIYISTFEPRKNHILLFLCWKKLHEILGKNTPKLLFIGKYGWSMDWLKEYIDKEPYIKDLIQCIENASDDTVKQLMITSYASLNPSYVEGWGMSAVESLAMGVPTVCSDIPAYRESTKGKAFYLSPLNVEEWINLILEILKGKHIPRQEIKLQTWEKHFESFRLTLASLSWQRRDKKRILVLADEMKSLYREIGFYNFKSSIVKFINRKLQLFLTN